eukprot:scaffold276420_cov18-Prasinocladus_malaysianus.AAC.1
MPANNLISHGHDHQQPIPVVVVVRSSSHIVDVVVVGDTVVIAGQVLDSLGFGVVVDDYK